jgi:hypothetical protein
MEKAVKQVRLHKPNVGINDFQTCYPELAKEWNYKKNSLLPNEITRGSSKSYWWICEKGHEWQAGAASRAKKHSGCPYCTNHFVLNGFNDIKTMYPMIAEEWHHIKNGSLTPSNFLASTTKKAWWIGKCGHEWQSSPINRIAGTGCPFCSGNKVLIGFNDFETRYPSISLEWHPINNQELTPNMFTYASNRRVWWLCKSGHEWETALSNRTFGTGCPSCSKSGFDQTVRSTFYFIENKELNARKIGITNYGTKRLKRMLNKGWVIVYSFSDDDGLLVNMLETKLKRWIKKECGLSPVLKNKDMGGLGGWSETFTVDIISNEEIMAKIEEQWYLISVES